MSAAPTRLLAAAGLLWLVAGSATLAQTVPPDPGAAPPAPLSGQMATPPVPQPLAPAARTSGNLDLSAVFAGDGRPIRAGLVWRVFSEEGAERRQKLVAKTTAAAPSITLAPGAYTVHAAYGFATASRRVDVGATGAAERLSIPGGALKLAGVIGDVPIAPNRLSFSVFLPMGADSEARLVAASVKAGEIVRLPEGSYHVVSTYGESNAILRVDLKVDSGRLTEATLNHRAATLTLKLVAAAGGEAFAGTAFSVLTPGGDVIREAIGAFPTVTLAEGDYVAIARHDGRVYTREFKVESGLDRDIEVLAKAQ
ncbi:MAG: hypothetical protein JWR08_1576 [Enterovirga sp.]|nr:hypothetical protein [Enterovirga sp.]